jgi:glycosyl transferase family 92
MMEKIGICAIFKDEAPYLLEWIAFHKIIGVDLFVLYDNGSSDGGAELIRQSSFARNVTILYWQDRPGQLSAYRHFHATYADAFTWVAFIDIDEFIVPLGAGSIRPVLLRKAYEPYADILLNWHSQAGW